MNIHPTAIVDKGADVDNSVSIGPYAVIEKGVRLGAGCVIGSHSVVTGDTTLGEGNIIGPFSTIGAPPQDLKYKDEKTRLVIGNDNRIREYVSIHRGTPGGNGVTTLGNQNLLMAYVHIAHDCTVGNQAIMANAATLGGHVEIGNRATIGGLTAVHQFTRIGDYAYIGGMSGVSKDVPPYVIMAGIRNQMKVSGINRIGLKRSGFSPEAIKNLIRAYKIIFRTPELLLQEALNRALEENPGSEEVAHLVEFFRTSKRSVVRAAGEEDE